MRSTIAPFVLALLTVCVTACGEKRDFVGTGAGRDRELPGQPDASTPDGSVINGMDGSVMNDMDGSAIDAGPDASYLDFLPDGSVFLADGGILLPDGEIIDKDTAEMRYSPEIDVSSCEISDLDLLQSNVTFADHGGFVLTPGWEAGFGLAYNAPMMGGCNSAVAGAYLPSVGALPTPSFIVSDCKVTGDVALLARQDGWQLAWIDNFNNGLDLFTMQLDSETLEPKGGAEREAITTNAFEVAERKPVLEEIAGRSMLTWVSVDEAGKHSVMGKVLEGSDTDAFTVVDGDEEQEPQSLALSPVGMNRDKGVLAWVGPIGNPGVWLQQLDENGKASGSPHRLTDRVGASSSVDIAPREDGGAVVYSIVIDGIPQVRFYRLAVDGAPRDSERPIITNAQDAAIAAVGFSGYAVTYRELQPGGKAQIRLILLSREGNVTRDSAGRPVSFLIADATAANSRTYVEVAVDGQMMIAWLDATEGNTNVMKVARRTLNCGAEE